MRSRFVKLAKKEGVSVLCVTLILLALFFNLAHQSQALSSLIDLNEMMSEAWEDWDGLLTRWFSVNGTVVDLYDYSRRNKGHPNTTTLSGIGFYVLALGNMYERTGDNYYLSKLRAIIEGLIDNPFCYTYVEDVGEIFFVPEYYFDGYEHDANPMITMITAFTSIKLWKWTGDLKFKQLADRVASESLRLAAINNSTDLAWSWAYYWGRDETHAKGGVNRQASITFFYTLYGKEVNLTYLDYIPRTLHWQFKAQLPSGALAYSIGETTENRPYTGVHIFLLISGYRIVPQPYMDYITNITNALSWLQTPFTIDFGYLEDYAVTGALINAWKANFDVNITKIKTATYIALKVFNFTLFGTFPRTSASAYGWRWSQYFTGSWLSCYPLPDGSFDPSQIPKLIDYSIYTTTQRNFEYRWGTNQGFDRFVINSYWGSGVYHHTGMTGSPLYFLFGRQEGTPTSTVENKTYYLQIKSLYAEIGSNVEKFVYASGLVIAKVTGTITFSVLQHVQDQVDITLANGTTLVLNELCNSTSNLGDTLIIRQHASPAHLFFVKSPNSTWTAYNQTSLLQLKTTVTDGKLLLVHLPISNISALDVLDSLNHYTTYLNQDAPLTFTQVIDSYAQSKQLIGGYKYGIPSWKAVYKTATRGEIRLIMHSHPDFVNISQWNYVDQRLTATISSSLGITSITKIYCGDLGKPIKVIVDGVEQAVNYNDNTKTLTFNVTHSGPSEIVIDWIQGDANDDGIVNIHDLVLVGKAYGTKEGDEGYILDADLNDDGIIDINDLAIVGKDYGKSV